MTPNPAITIRSAQADDAAALHRLAQLDSRTVPAGDLLVAEVDGELRAAVARDARVSIADPFRPTAELVDLLRAHANRQRAQLRRPWLALRRSPAATPCPQS